MLFSKMSTRCCTPFVTVAAIAATRCDAADRIRRASGRDVTVARIAAIWADHRCSAAASVCKVRRIFLRTIFAASTEFVPFFRSSENISAARIFFVSGGSCRRGERRAMNRWKVSGVLGAWELLKTRK